MSASPTPTVSVPQVQPTIVEFDTNIFKEKQSSHSVFKETVFSSLKNATIPPTISVPQVRPTIAELETDSFKEKPSSHSLLRGTVFLSLENVTVPPTLAAESFFTPSTSSVTESTPSFAPPSEIIEEESPSESSPSDNNTFFQFSNYSFICPPPSNYQTRLQRYIADNPNKKYNYLMDIPSLIDNLLRQRHSTFYFRKKGTLASILKEFGHKLYHRCQKKKIQFSFCQYHWLVAWDSTTHEFYPFHEQNRSDSWNS